ncbi:MAG: nickel pincer cofactor biosynthesis protein LarB [Acidobacteria bacterium]|nr:nickel pincer cofactor biosynthesis protein LarB [Acidobacteriota bacterium]
MTEAEIRKLLEGVRRGKVSPARAVERLKRLPFEDLGFAKIDHHRSLRQGYAEVVYAPGKRPEQVASIVRRMASNRQNILVTRAGREVFRAVKRVARAAEFHELSGVISIRRTRQLTGKGLVLVVSAGTADIPVAEEALITAEMMGNRVEALYDVGVAGIHRLIRNHPKLIEARVIVCVAGMEGALPSVVGGLVSVPVIAVPTSVGYGASLKGLAALLAMLNSCASNVAVVNIDNGFGAGCLASVINRL